MLFRCTTDDLIPKVVERADNQRHAELSLEEPEAISEDEDDTDDEDNDPVALIKDELEAESQRRCLFECKSKTTKNCFARSRQQDESSSSSASQWPKRAGLSETRRPRYDDYHWAYHPYH